MVEIHWISRVKSPTLHSSNWRVFAETLAFIIWVDFTGEIWVKSARFHGWNPPDFRVNFMKSLVIAPTLHSSNWRVFAKTLAFIILGGFHRWNLPDFTGEICQISQVKSTRFQGEIPHPAFIKLPYRKGRLSGRAHKFQRYWYHNYSRWQHSNNVDVIHFPPKLWRSVTWHYFGRYSKPTKVASFQTFSIAIIRAFPYRWRLIDDTRSTSQFIPLTVTFYEDSIKLIQKSTKHQENWSKERVMNI